MKKSIFLILTVVLFAAACNKGNPTNVVVQPNARGSFTWKSLSSNPQWMQATGTNAPAQHPYATIYWDDTTSPTRPGVIFTFDTLPTQSGTYNVIYLYHPFNQFQPQTFTSNHQVNVYFATDTNPNPETNYVCTGGNGMETINITIVNDKITMSGSGIEFVNISNPSDSAPGSFNFTGTGYIP